MSEIKAALTAEELERWDSETWRMSQVSVFSHNDVGVTQGSTWYMWEMADPPVVRKKIAALCLHDQPFGFTHRDVGFLREYGAWLRDMEINDNKITESEWMLDLADRIEALLPPEDLRKEPPCSTS